jgi:phenylacetate-CoA ligase
MLATYMKHNTIELKAIFYYGETIYNWQREFLEELFQCSEGRVQDFVVSKTKRFVPFMGVHHLVAKSSKNVKECQLYQERQGENVLRVVRRETYSEHDARRIQESFLKRFGDEFSLTLTCVDSIPWANRVKYQFLVQKLPIHFSP